MYCWYAQEGKSKVILWLIKLINFHNVVTLIIAWTAGKEHTAITYFDWKAVSSLWEEKLPQQHPLWMFHVGNFHYEYFIYRNVKKGAAQSRVAVSWLECCPVLHWIQWWKRHEVDFEFFFLYFLLSRGFLYARSKTKNCVLTVCLSALMWGCVLDAKVADELISCVFKTRLDMTHITIIGLIKVRIWASQLIRLSWTKSPYMLDQHIWWDSLILRFVPCCND